MANHNKQPEYHVVLTYAQVAALKLGIGALVAQPEWSAAAFKTTISRKAAQSALKAINLAMTTPVKIPPKVRGSRGRFMSPI